MVQIQYLYVWQTTNTSVGFLCRFPQLFPPLKPEVVAQRTVDAVRTNTAFVYLPWTMHALVILKRYSLNHVGNKIVFQKQIISANMFWFALHLITLLYPSNSMLPQSALEEIHKFSGSYTCMNTFKGRTWEVWKRHIPSVTGFYSQTAMEFLWSIPEAMSYKKKAARQST